MTKEQSLTRRKSRIQGVYPYKNGRFAVRRGTPGKKEHHSSFHRTETAARLTSAVYSAIDNEEKCVEPMLERLDALSQLVKKNPGSGGFVVNKEDERDALWAKAAADSIEVGKLAELFEEEVQAVVLESVDSDDDTPLDNP